MGIRDYCLKLTTTKIKIFFKTCSFFGRKNNESQKNGTRRCRFNMELGLLEGDGFTF
jgi:hypothetical protein